VWLYGPKEEDMWAAYICRPFIDKIELTDYNPEFCNITEISMAAVQIIAAMNITQPFHVIEEYDSRWRGPSWRYPRRITPRCRKRPGAERRPRARAG
jgi:hypothetical protein